MVKWSRNGLVRSGSDYIDETYFQTHGPVMCFDGSDGSKIEASNVAGSDRPIALHWELPMVVILNRSIELGLIDSSLDGWYVPFKRRRFEDSKLPVKGKERSQNGRFSFAWNR